MKKMSDMFKWTKKENNLNDNIELDNEEIYIEDEIKTYVPEEKTKVYSDQITSAKYSPKTLNDMEEAAKAFLANGKIVISFRNMSDVDRKKSLNFLSGVIFAVDGTIRKVEPKIYEFKFEK